MARLGGGVAMQGVSERLTASAIGSMPGGDHRIIAAASGMLVAVIGSESTVGIMPTTRGITAHTLITGTATGGIGQAGRTSAVFQEASAVVHTAAGIVARR